MIKLENINLKYLPDFFCLYNFNTEISTHTLFVGDEFLGTHSILRLLAKIDLNFEGNILIDNISIKDIKDKDLNIAYITSNPVLFGGKSLEKNLAYPLKIRKINKKIIKNNVNTMILEYKLNEFPKKIKNMSITEKKIVTLIRAILRQPKYILLEDFFENFDTNYLSLAHNLINRIKTFSTIIACEKEIENVKYFDNFDVVSLYKF